MPFLVVVVSLCVQVSSRYSYCGKHERRRWIADIRMNQSTVRSLLRYSSPWTWQQKIHVIRWMEEAKHRVREVRCA